MLERDLSLSPLLQSMAFRAVLRQQPEMTGEAAALSCMQHQRGNAMLSEMKGLAINKQQNHSYIDF